MGAQELTAEEMELVAAYRAATEDGRRALIAAARALAEYRHGEHVGTVHVVDGRQA